MYILGFLQCFIYKGKKKSLISYILTPLKWEFAHIFILCGVESFKTEGGGVGRLAHACRGSGAGRAAALLAGAPMTGQPGARLREGPFSGFSPPAFPATQPKPANKQALPDSLSVFRPPETGERQTLLSSDEAHILRPTFSI